MERRSSVSRACLRRTRGVEEAAPRSHLCLVRTYADDPELTGVGIKLSGIAVASSNCGNVQEHCDL